jgi:predicted ATP-dependent endonuclease of OLD family
MYIKSVEIENIRSISNFKMEFEQPAGWHVIIGDNGAGKSTIIKSIALTLVGPEQAMGLRDDWRNWLSNNSDKGKIDLRVTGSDQNHDKQTGRSAQVKSLIPNILFFEEFVEKDRKQVKLKSNLGQKGDLDPARFNWGNGSGWFSVAYGPYRRFEGGNPDWNKVFYSQPKLGAHLSAFGEDVALTEATEWLMKLNYQALEKKQESNIINNLKLLINSEDFLPHRAELESISSEGVMFKDGNGTLISVNQLSDGYRSILSLTFELIRQLLDTFSENSVFRNIQKGVMKIDQPGVVLIDEIDAHLHPTWQTRIGQWFLKYFPNIQFIVTTHSPLVCRASEHGTIWRLAAPGSNVASGEIKGIDRDRLIKGNILDAYGTEIFGEHVSISEEANAQIDRLAELNVKSMLGQIVEEEQAELIKLKTIFPTEKPL